MQDSVMKVQRAYQVLSNPHGVTGQPLVGVLVGGGLDEEGVLPL